MNTIKSNTNTALFTLDLVAQCEANLILDMLDAQYKQNFGHGMSKKSREKAFKQEADALFSYYLEDTLAA